MTEPRLHIGKGAHGFTLPIELVTSTQAILARKRSGKSYTASVQAEELLDHKQQIVVVDPTSAWWGLRSNATGDGPGYPVVVFGGDHADAPLDFRAGKDMATAIIQHGFSAIFDIGDWETDEQILFVYQFTSEMLRINREAIHLFIDEADAFAPQLLESREQKKCLGAMSRLVKQGGVKGLGVTMITQRSADINKKLLSQIDILTVLRMSAPDDMVAPIKWIAANVSPEYAKEVEKALPRLAIGSGYVCSNLTSSGHHVEVRPRRTFNSGATPKPGERKVEPKVLAKVDIEKLGQKISDSVKRAQEDSPEFLRKRIAQLESEVGGKVDMGVLEDVQRMETELAELRPLRDELLRVEQRSHERVNGFISRIQAVLDEYRQGDASWKSWEPPATTTNLPAAAVSAHVASRVTQSPRVNNTSEPTGLQQRILRSLAEFAAIGRKEVLRSTLSAWAEARGGYFARTLGEMKTSGLIEYPTPGTIGLTEMGTSTAPKVERPQTRHEFFEACVAQAGTGLPERIMRALKHAHPEALPREQLSGLVSATGGYFSRTVGEMKTAGFIEYPTPGAIRLQPWTVMQ